MLEQHSMELTRFHGLMTAEAPKKAKFSKDLLNLRKIQATLARQKNYVEAQKVKLKGDRLESVELDRINRDKGERYAKREALILGRHRQELLAMRKRMERGRIELERRRKKELEMLVQRYNNVKRGLLGQQNIIKAKTGSMLLKHAANKKTDASGSQAIVTSMHSGTFGPGLKKRTDAFPSAKDVVKQIQQEVAQNEQESGAAAAPNQYPPADGLVAQQSTGGRHLPPVAAAT